MRRRVLLLVAATTLLVLVAFLVPLALLVRNVAADRAVQSATAQAQALTSLVATTDRTALDLTVQQADAVSGYDVTVFLADGVRLGAPAQRSPLVELAWRGSSASADVTGGREIVFAVDRPGGVAGVIRTFVPDAELDPRRRPARGCCSPGSGSRCCAVSLLVADRLARTAGPLDDRPGGGVAPARPRRADARADEAAPGELGVVAGALNGLAGRITGLLREERETIADLSHRVRTPLTALRLEAESLSAADAERIGAGVDAVNRAVTEVIQQARRRGAEPSGVDATEVVRERVAFWAVLAEDTDRALTVDIGPGPLPVALSARGPGGVRGCLAGQRVRAHPERHAVRRAARRPARRRDAGGRRRRAGTARRRPCCAAGSAGPGRAGWGWTSCGARPSRPAARCGSSRARAGIDRWWWSWGP